MARTVLRHAPVGAGPIGPHRGARHRGVGDGTFPEIPASACQPDQAYLTEPGQTTGWSACHKEATERAMNACPDGHGIVGRAVDHLPRSRTQTMRWTGAAILFALTAAVAAIVFLRGRERVL